MPLLSAKRLPLRVPSTGTVMEVCPDSENVEPVNVPLSCPVIDAVAPAAVTVKPEGPLPSVTLTNVAPANERRTLHRSGHLHPDNGDAFLRALDAATDHSNSRARLGAQARTDHRHQTRE